VIHVQRNQTFRAMGASTDYDDPLFELQYGKYRTELVKLHRVTTGKDVRVGIVDSSVDLRHPDLDGQIDRHSRFLSGSGTLGLTHGTAVAGVIGAASNNGLGVVGLAPMADIHIFAACRNSFGNADTSTSCSSFALAKALEAAIEARIDVLNMSLAGPRDRLLTQLLDVALKRGMIVIAAENVEDEVHNFPASMDGVLGVDGRMGYWFTHPEHLTTQAGGGYQVFRGTSVSAAGLSGVAALLRTMLSHSETMEVLRQMTEVDCAKSSGIQQVVYGANACI
jgi:subtilisin family serine protease